MARASTFAARPVYAKPQLIFWPVAVIYRNLKGKAITLKFSVHCLLDNKTI